ncbi:MAG: hypothetical protein O3B47_04370 [bacterium]|nr:hypothetical protein [bacterium]
MDPILLIVVIFLVILTVIKFFEDSFCLDATSAGRKIVSFLTGAAIVTVFLDLLDEIYLGIHAINDFVVLVLPVAFIVVFLLENHIYHHSKKKKYKEQRILIKSISFLAGTLVGLIAMSNFQENIFKEIIFMALIVSYDLMREVSLHLMHEDRPEKLSKIDYLLKILMSSSPFFGFFLAYYFDISDLVNIILLTIFGGAVIYVLMREIIPKEKDIYPIPFLTGVVFLMAIFFMNFYV